jgi:hypothetical protein
VVGLPAGLDANPLVWSRNSKGDDIRRIALQEVLICTCYMDGFYLSKFKCSRMFLFIVSYNYMRGTTQKPQALTIWGVSGVGTSRLKFI